MLLMYTVMDAVGVLVDDVCGFCWWEESGYLILFEGMVWSEGFGLWLWGNGCGGQGLGHGSLGYRLLIRCGVCKSDGFCCSRCLIRDSVGIREPRSDRDDMSRFQTVSEHGMCCFVW